MLADLPLKKESINLSDSIYPDQRSLLATDPTDPGFRLISPTRTSSVLNTALSLAQFIGQLTASSFQAEPTHTAS